MDWGMTTIGTNFNTGIQILWCLHTCAFYGKFNVLGGFMMCTLGLRVHAEETAHELSTCNAAHRNRQETLCTGDITMICMLESTWMV